ncbi:hypothetical protein [Helicobacter bizzozeronii]|uniref:hypothetical protein n=1 Tax=Helicobacter bizzozeronii TaxID=56877 RepID=UPI000CF0E393|nr:hypothetical protein [Helicobacter bizzozeronii]
MLNIFNSTLPSVATLKSLLSTLCLLSVFLNPIWAFNLNLAIYEEYDGPRADTCPGDLIKDEALQDKVICDIYGNARDSGDIDLAILNRFYSDFYHQVRAGVSPQDRQKVRQISLKAIHQRSKECIKEIEANLENWTQESPEDPPPPPGYYPMEVTNCMEGAYANAFRQISALLFANPQYTPIFKNFFYTDPQKYHKLILNTQDYPPMYQFSGQVAQDDLMDKNGKWLAPEIREAHRNVRQWLTAYLQGQDKNLPKNYNPRDLSQGYISDTKTLKQGQDVYTFILEIWIRDSPPNEFPYHSCLGILHQGQLQRAFCMEQRGDYTYQRTSYAFKSPFFTLSIEQDLECKGKFFTPHIDHYTFGLIEGQFYLHQYSREVFYATDCDWDRENSEHLTTQIFYRQSRDDPEGKHRISMQDFVANMPRGDFGNQALKARIQESCFQRGLCRWVKQDKNL